MISLSLVFLPVGYKAITFVIQRLELLKEGAERLRQARRARKQRNHIMLALRAFVRLEWHRYLTGPSRDELKKNIIRYAMSQYLKDPKYTLDINPSA